MYEMGGKLTSESAPLSAPGHVNVTYSWHRLCTTKLHTVTEMTRSWCSPLGALARVSVSSRLTLALITLLPKSPGKEEKRSVEKSVLWSDTREVKFSLENL